MAKKIIEIKVNGEPYELAVDTWRTLLEVLREDLHLTGTKQGCGQGQCGACTVLVDGAAVNACLYLAAEAHQREVETIEGLAPDGGSLHPIQEAFIQSGAADCGSCAPGLMMSAKHLLSRNPAPSGDESRSPSAVISAAAAGFPRRCRRCKNWPLMRGRGSNMPSPRFNLYQPTSVEEALDYLAMHRTSVKVLAGGTGILPQLRSGKLELLHLVSLGKVRGMRKISWAEDDGMVIGANVRVSEVAASDEVKLHYPALAQACARLATPQVRNLATLVGNVAWGDPFADAAAPLLAYDASLVVIERGARRQIHLNDYYAEPGKSALESFEMIEAVRIPAPPERTGSLYLRQSTMSRSQRAAVGVAVFVTQDLQGNVLKARLALMGAAPLPVRCLEAEQILDGQPPQADLLARAGAACVRAARPIDDARASANYRRLMVMTLAQKAIAASVEQIKGKSHA